MMNITEQVVYLIKQNVITINNVAPEYKTEVIELLNRYQ